jgi:eukaryotic-like serine/threonine-protein kinase
MPRQNRLIGRQVAGRFTIKRLLGEGGMATVYVAEQAEEPREVALKIMNEELSADRTFVKRFQREAKAAARVQHPNSVRLIDYGVADGLSYIAMELLEGADLYVLLEREGAISQGRAVRILVEVCDALSVAHELGIVHRDLKPENIMVVADPTHPNGERVKVLDFGIAKLLAPDAADGTVDPRLDPQSAVTRAGTFIGTPAYMSPEQCSLLPVDTRADIYTCGVLLYQLVTGRLPFEGQTPLHTATLHIHEPPPRPSSVAPEIDPRLEGIILKALAKKPTDRHQTSRHLATTLRRILGDLPDVRVAQIAPGQASVRPATTRARGPKPGDGAPAPSSAPDSLAMESAKTMVAQGAGGPPPAVVLRLDIAAASDPLPDKAPAPHEDGPESEDGDDMRTLVRSPTEPEETHRFGPKNTEVMEVPGHDGGHPSTAAPAPIKDPKAPRVPPSVKQTLKSEDFKGVAFAVARAKAAAERGHDDGAARAEAAAPERTSGLPPERISVTPNERALGPAAFAETAKASPAVAAAVQAVSSTAATEPLISPAMVASVIAKGPPRPPAPSTTVVVVAAPSGPQPPPPPGPPPPGQLAPASVQISAAFPQPPSVAMPVPVAPPPAPLARVEEGRFSGTRGLLVGFLAGAVLMAALALAYWILGRPQP